MRSLVRRGVAVAVAFASFVPFVFASANDEQILGFESLSDWSVSEGAGTVSLNNASSSGQHSVTLGGTGFRRMASANLTTLGLGDASVIQVDVRVDAGSLDSWESAGLVVKIPSRGIYWQDLGMIGLGGVQPGAWSTLSFPVPGGLREALQSTTLQDIQVIVAANTTSAPVSFDRLRLLTPPPGNPPPPRPTVTPPQSSELGKPYTPRFLSCSTSTTTVTDVDAEFEDIWAKRETPWQGKRTSQIPSIGLRFSGPVNPSMVNASFFPRNVSECGNRIQAAAVAAPALWQGAAASSPSGRLSASDYNAIILGSVSGTPSSEGPIAAGGSVTLSSFSLNGSAQRPIGLIAGGSVSLSNGSVHGNVQTSTAWTPPQSVSITAGAPTLGAGGLVSGTMLSLSELSSSLGSSGSTGTTASAWGGLTLTGSEAERNVFEVSAGDLASASNVTISVPSGSSAIVNIRGTFGSIKNKGFNLQGITAERLLWNAPELVSVEIASVAFPGSLLAPRADVVFNNGNFRGTLVAFSLNGSGSFSFAPLDALSVLGEGSSDLVRFLPVKKLRPECEYTFEIVANQALSDAGNCLDKWFVVRFFTRPDGAGVMDDLAELRRTENAPGLTAFAPRLGVYINAEEALVRYKEAMGVPIDDSLELDGTQRRHPRIVGAEIVRARQYHEGVFVRSPGYFVERFTDGRLIYARGRAVVLPEDSSTPTLSRSAARSAAAPYVLETGGPGTTLGPEEDITLRYVNGRGTPANEDYELAWNVPVISGDHRVGEVDISATTGGLVRHSHYREFAHNADYATHMQTLSFQGMTPIVYTTAYGTTSTFEGVQLTDGSGNVWKTFASKDPTTNPQALDLTAGYFLEGSLYQTSYIPHDTDGDGIISWSSGTDSLESRSAVLAALYATVLPAEQYLLEFPLEFEDDFWRGIDGTGLHGVTVQYQRTPPRANSRPGVISYRPTFVSIPTIEYTEGEALQYPLPFPTAGYHELGHSVFNWLRERTGQKGFDSAHETGAISEGLGDIFATSVALAQGTVSSSSWPVVRTLSGFEAYDRHTGSPETTENPAFYKGPRYCADSDILCDEIHDNSTILSHWAYLLTVGSSGTGICNVPVPALEGNLPESRKSVMQLLFDSVPELAEMGRFIDLRDLTYKRASQTSEAMAKAIGSAWLAVGLGSPTSPMPPDGEKNVNPWDTRLEFIASLPGEYTLQIAEDENFTVESQRRFLDAEEAGSDVSTIFTLRANTRYHWRVAPGRIHTEEGWGQCSLGTWSFTTADRKASIETMAYDEDDDRYETDFLGLVKVQTPQGTTEVGLQFSTNEPPDCEDALDYVTPFSIPKEVLFHLGDAFTTLPPVDVPGSSGHRPQPYAPSGWFPEENYQDWGIRKTRPDGDGEFLYPWIEPVFGTLLPGSVGYLTVTPIRFGERGNCSTFELTTTELGEFAVIAADPASENWNRPRYVVLDHETGKPNQGFDFTPSAGALEYEAIFRTVKGTSVPADPEEGVLSRVVLKEADVRNPDCGMQLDDGLYTWTFDGCGNDDFLERFGSGVPRESNQFRYFEWEIWAHGDGRQRRLSAIDGLGAGRGLGFTFAWDKVAWIPWNPAVKPHMTIQNGGDYPIWIYATSPVNVTDFSTLTDLYSDLEPSEFPSFENWSDVRLGTTRSSVNREDAPHPIRFCVPKQLPFLDQITADFMLIRNWGLDNVELSVLSREQHVFDSAQGKKDPSTDCITIPMNTRNPPDDRIALVFRGHFPGHPMPPQGLLLSDIFGELEEGETAPRDGEENGNNNGGNNGSGNGGTNCLQHVPTPEPAPNQTLSPCTSTNELYGTVPLGGHDVGIYGATCPVTAPSVTSLSLGVKRDPSVAGYYVGVCGDQGSCTSRHVKPGDQILPQASPTSLMINSVRNRYTVSVFAHDECDNLSDSLNVQFDYIGPGCNDGQDGSACGSVCGKCCHDGCDFECSDDNCGSCSADNPYDLNACQ